MSKRRKLGDSSAAVVHAGSARPRSAAQVIGIDWSGAERAGQGIWLADCTVEAKCRRPRVIVRDVRSASELPGSSAKRDACLPALRRHLQSQVPSSGHVLVGLDSAMSVAGCLAGPQPWKEFVNDFRNKYPSAAVFRERCRRKGGGKEPKRACDVVAKTPFPPQNLRMYRQTYHAIADLIHPLMQNGHVCVPPMTPLRERCIWLLEVCPASLLKRWDGGILYKAYKGKAAHHQHARKEIVRSIEGGVPGAGERDRRWIVRFSSPALRRRVTDDPGGDALDSVLAAVGAVCAASAECFPAPWTGWDPRYKNEGCVYA
mmetsp:Transcript_93860/g.265530  ORF Transcript_93860/g.265530 Transcript_93860/m.265530 type:complete len:316 (+) Transcript_93860:54-1001(+)